MKKKLATPKYLQRIFCVMLCIILCGGFFLKSDIHIYAQEAVLPDNLNTEGYDIVYVIDNSRSIWTQQEIRNEAFENITNLAVGSDMRIGIVYFADHIYDTLALTSMETEEGSRKVLEFLDMKEQDEANRDTNIGNALEAAIQLFDGQNKSREKIIVLFSDGLNENYEQEESYMIDANRKTEEQAGLLKDKIDIYCVYLQKDRNDEEYLKKVVNYFSEDKSYAEERFFKVKEQEIATLSETFQEVFFAMQNNVKCAAVKLDSSGTANFYLPSLGIEQLRIYLDGDNLKGTVTPPGECGENISFQYETANFVLYKEPALKDWKIEITEGEINEIYGTIAYHAYLSATCELKKVEDSKEYELYVSFYNKSKKETAIDENAVVKTTILVSKEDGTKVEIPLEMKIVDGEVKSVPFVMSEYGQYSYEIELIYNDTFTNEEMINLHYLIQGDTYEKTPLSVYDKKGEKLIANKTENGMEFAIKEDTLFYDSDGDIVNITGFKSVNTENPVHRVWQEDGYLYFVAETVGDAEVKLQITNIEGEISEVTIQGEVIDEEVEEKKDGMKMKVILLLLLIFVLRRMSNKKKEKRVKVKAGELLECCSKLEKDMAVCEEKLNDLAGKKADLEYLLEGEDEEEGLIDIAENFDETQLKSFGEMPYLAPDFTEKKFSDHEERNSLNHAKEFAAKMREKAKTFEKKQQNVRSALKEVLQLIEEVEKENDVMLEVSHQLEKRNQDVEELIQVAAEKGDFLAELLETEIPYDLFVTNIESLPTDSGMWKAVIGGRRQQGFYRLDDVKLLSGGMFGKSVGMTDIYIYGYEGGDEKEPIKMLCFRSLNGFECRKAGDTADFVQKNELLLGKKDEYELRIQTDRDSESIRVKAQ